MMYQLIYPSPNMRMITDTTEDKQKAIALLYNARLRLDGEIAKIDKQMSEIKMMR